MNQFLKFTGNPRQQEIKKNKTKYTNINQKVQRKAGAPPRSFHWGTDRDWGEQIQVSQNHLPPNSDFSSEFDHSIWELLENLKVLANIQGKTLKIAISGGTSPRISNRGSPPPLGSDAHGCKTPIVPPVSRTTVTQHPRSNAEERVPPSLNAQEVTGDLIIDF